MGLTEFKGVLDAGWLGFSLARAFLHGRDVFTHLAPLPPRGMERHR